MTNPRLLNLLTANVYSYRTFGIWIVLLHRIWKDQPLALTAKLRVNEALVLSVLIYAAETLTLIATVVKALEAFHMKCQILGICWFDFVSNHVNAQARTGLKPLGEILAAHRISIFGHIVPLENDVPAHMALRRHSDLSVGRPPGPVWRRRPGRPRSRWIDQIRRDSSSSPVELGRRAIRRGHATQRSPSATQN